MYTFKYLKANLVILLPTITFAPEISRSFSIIKSMNYNINARADVIKLSDTCDAQLNSVVAWGFNLVVFKFFRDISIRIDTQSFDLNGLRREIAARSSVSPQRLRFGHISFIKISFFVIEWLLSCLRKSCNWRCALFLMGFSQPFFL